MLEQNNTREWTPYANSIFEQPYWLDIVSPGKWREAIIYDKAGKIIARLPYVTENNRIQNPPFTQTCGIWMDDSLRKKVRGNSHLNNKKWSLDSEITFHPNRGVRV